jgi:GntR family transcriptional regulator
MVFLSQKIFGGFCLMTMLTKTEGVALYVQVRETLRNQIKTGVLKPGQKLLAEDELAAQFGVSRMTVRQGIVDLTDEGILYRRRGIGTFVTQFHVERDHNKLTDFFETAQAEGFEAEVRLLSREVVPAKIMVAKALALQETEPVIRIQTLRLANEVPVTLYAVQRNEPRAADEDVARALNIQMDAPILFKNRVISAEDGTPVELILCHNRGDSYSAKMILVR